MGQGRGSFCLGDRDSSQAAAEQSAIEQGLVSSGASDSDQLGYGELVLLFGVQLIAQRLRIFHADGAGDLSHASLVCLSKSLAGTDPVRMCPGPIDIHVFHPSPPYRVCR
ncbi:hypothetical protein D3C77_301860 [compost metagenome]